MPITPELPTDTDRQLRFTLLGPLRARRGDTEVEPGPVREQALLAALLLRPGRTVSRQQLLDGVWGADPPGTGARVIPVYVHRLRRRLDVPGQGPADSVIVTVRSGYRFVPHSARVDVAHCEELAAHGRAARDRGDLDGAVDAWSRALELFRGEPLAGVPGPFAEGERRRLAEWRLTLVQDVVDGRLRLGRHAETVGELFALTAAHPYHEALAALLMRALHAGHRRADALDVYTAVRRRLVDEQGVEPGAELRRVHEAVLRGDDGLVTPHDGVDTRHDGVDTRHDGVVTPDVRAPAADLPAPLRDRARRPRHELPVDTGHFTGRTRELEVLTAPADEHVVTVRAVDGMAGVGKTALVVRAARTLLDRCPDGCLFVELHGHREDRPAAGRRRSLRRLLRAVGAGAGEDVEDLDELAASWRTATASLRLLLVLDDVSRAEQVRPLLPAGPGSMVLITSRRRLTGLDADRRVSLSPLGLDEAAGLLGRVIGGGRSDRERTAVRELAALCDRLPLALRIVGARLQDGPAWAVEALAARLADDERRLDELAVEDRSVEAAFRVSYDRLPPAEQRAFRALGTAPTVRLDRLTLAALLGDGDNKKETDNATDNDPERLLESLADASLVQRVAAGRYRLHDLAAVYARRVAATAPEEVAAGRAGVFRLYVVAARCASDWGGSLPTGPRGTDPFTDWEEATAWLDAAGGELVDVVGQALAADRVDDACRLAEALVDYLTRQGRFHECRTALEKVLPVAGRTADRRTAAALRTGLGIMYGQQGRYQQARACFGEALDLSRRAGDPHERARAAAGLGTFANLEGRIAESMTYFAEVASLLGQFDDDGWLMGSVMTRVGDIHHRLGEYDKAHERYLEAITYAERTGSPRLHGKALLRLGSLQLDLDRPAEAVGTLGKAEDLARRLGDVPLYSAVLGELATAEERLGNRRAAAEQRHRARAVLDEQTCAETEIATRHRLVWQGTAAQERAGARDFFERGTALPAADVHRATISRALDDIGGGGRRQTGE